MRRSFLMLSVILLTSMVAGQNVKEDYYDGEFFFAEEDYEEWIVEGFTRATARIPQAWHLQHITYAEDGPQVQILPVDSTGELFLTFESRTQRPSILIVAATAPTTLEKASYELNVD